MVTELLKAAADKVAEAALRAERHAEYVARRDQVANELKNLPTDDKIADERLKAGQALAKAKMEAEDGKYSAAHKTLAAADALCSAGKLKNKMHAKTVPTPAELKKLADHKPDGLKLLDDVVKGLPQDTPRNVLKELLEVRFDIKFEMFTKDAKADKTDHLHKSDMTKKGHSMQKLYELMIKCPEAQTKDNPNMKLIKRYGGKKSDLTNFYRGSKGLISLSCGRSKDLKKEKFAEIDELPDVIDSCKPTAQPLLFDSTAYHEVAHSVDEKQSFMRKHAGDAKYGGWEDYGSNVIPVAIAAGKHFGVSNLYIAKVLSGDPTPPPGKPNTLTETEWEELLKKVNDWCADIRLSRPGNNLYWDGEGSKKAAIGTPKRVYHESYDGQWVSYLLDARTKGISGYQFRAPGEWFAEIYSAYFNGVLKDNNPAMTWLKDFKRPTV